MTEHNYIGLKQPKFNFCDVIVIAWYVWTTWGSQSESVPALLHFILAGVYFLARPYLFTDRTPSVALIVSVFMPESVRESFRKRAQRCASSPSPQKTVPSVEDSLRAVLQEQTKARRDDCINEYTDLLLREHREKEYLKEHTDRHQDLEPWPGTSNVDVTWIDEELPYNYEFRRRVERLKRSIEGLSAVSVD